MKNFDVYSRYGTKYKAVLVDENTIHFHVNNSTYIRQGAMSSDSLRLGFIDPEGGPFISLFETPAFCLHKDLPEREIIDISFDKNHYVLKLEGIRPDIKNKRSSKTKIKPQTILKHKKLIRN